MSESEKFLGAYKPRCRAERKLLNDYAAAYDGLLQQHEWGKGASAGAAQRHSVIAATEDLAEDARGNQAAGA